MDDLDWSFAAKWPSEVVGLGFTMVPNALLRYCSKLRITPPEFLVLINIESYRWEADRLPYPSIETLTTRTGTTKRSVIRAITSLEDARGVIRRVKRTYASNEYSFDPLFVKLVTFIKNDAELQKERQISHGEADIFARMHMS
jgi:hypothetical protein